MGKKILVTGGAGFIGSHLVDELVKSGHDVMVYDSLVPENFGFNQEVPSYFSKKASLIRATLLDYEILKNAVKEAEIIFHLASKLGIGKSMYEIRNFIQDNTLGTSNLLNILVNENHSVKKLIVASSNSIYGEGLAICDSCGIIKPKMREKYQLEKKDWNTRCPICSSLVKPTVTNENVNPDCTSIYAHTKLHQEQLCLLIGKAYSIETTALRFFNVLGPRQALSNPYTGVCAIFTTSLLCGNSPLIYEDGGQTRDFVNVYDVVQALILAMNEPNSKNEVFNVGTGTATSVLQLAEKLSDLINPTIKPKIVAQARFGDIRHCISDIAKIKEKLGYRPKYKLEDSLKQVIEWIKIGSKNKKLLDRSSEAEKELKDKGII